MELIKRSLEQIVASQFGAEISVELSRPDAQFGDFATNIALQLAKQVGKNPREIAEQLAAALKSELKEQVSEVSVAGPGFINLRLSDAVLLAQLSEVTNISQALAGKTVVVEYSDPNPFKVLHAGHLYTSVVGDAIANLQEAGGATVHRVNFGGDVGLHVGKTMWAILQNLDGENPKKLQSIPANQRAQWLSDRYIEGNNAYHEDAQAKEVIVALNKRVYQLHAEKDTKSSFAQIYWTTRQWSYDYFDQFYARIGTKFEKYYPESETTELGLKIVKEQLTKGVFIESDGAVVFKGEDHGLHTRVFINSQGLPTYEAKDVGLIMTKWDDYHFDKSIIITANDIVEYMKVVLKAIEHFAPELVQRTTHLTHGIVKLKGGVKMSSRKGNILRAVEVLDAAAVANNQATGKNDSHVELGAIKYAFLKVRTGGDIMYDPKESVSIEGNSGPYLQYAHARARSILAKASEQKVVTLSDLQLGERFLVSKLVSFPETVEQAIDELAPHLVCTYLYELAQTFNRFYEQNRVLGEPREAQRLQLVRNYAEVLKMGLQLLGIHAPETM